MEGAEGVRDALEILRTDHERLDALFDRFELSSASSERRTLFGQIRQELELLVELEEGVFFPFFTGTRTLREQTKRFQSSHRKIHRLLEQLSRTGLDRSFDRKMARLLEISRLHARDEEEDLFPEIEKRYDTVQLQLLGAQMEEAKEAMPGSAAA